jgi:hypothetical protein
LTNIYLSMYPQSSKNEQSYQGWQMVAQPWYDCSETARTSLFSRRSSEQRRRMQAAPDNMQAFNGAGQNHVELVPFSASAIAMLLFALLLTYLTLTGLTTKLATSTA